MTVGRWEGAWVLCAARYPRRGAGMTELWGAGVAELWGARGWRAFCAEVAVGVGDGGLGGPSGGWGAH